MKHFISLGAGVQSSTMALMAAHGEITPMPEAAVFADTGWEPASVYNHLQWLMSGVLPFPVHVVKHSNLREDLLAGENSTQQRFAAVPFYIEAENGERGMGRRQCTSEYKINPVQREMRRLLGYEPRQRIPPGSASVWIGISSDEASRMKPARLKWQSNRWPLIEAEMTRWDCLNWMERNGYPAPPKSSCIGCPFHNDAMWRDMKLNDPKGWADAVYVDDQIRNGGTQQSKNSRGKQYMHRSCKPLGQVDFRNAEDRGQLNFFENECEGMCGV